MVLDFSPESFSPQMNSTSLFLWFQLVIPSFDPKGHQMNKIDKDLQGDATYQQERQIVARYARLTPSCKAGACTGQNSSMKNNKGH